MKKNFDRIEAQLRALFEKRLISLFSDKAYKPTLLDGLIQVMKENLKEGLEDVLFAPDRFVLEVPPEEFSFWMSHQNILAEIASEIQNTGLHEGFRFQTTPDIVIEKNLDMPNNQFSISASYSTPKPSLPDTAVMTRNEQEKFQPILPENALFVIGGKSNFPLEKSVINIGRHSDNDLILNDPHVSRHHAQLRLINHRFVIFDVGSSSGLFLNGKQIHQATLQSGDVIRLGVTNLIYVQDSTGENPTTVIPVDSEDRPSKGTQK
jgi:hypothetical protein